MKHILVIGAGIVGLASAYELRQRGFEVTVIEAQGKAGQETSKANGAQLSYSFVSPLASPVVLRTLHKLLLDRQGALRIRPRADGQQINWLLHFLAACSVSQNRQASEDLLHLGSLSKSVLTELLQQHPIAFSHNRNGKLMVFESDASLTGARDQARFLRSHGVSQEELSADEACRLEPSLLPIKDRIEGAFFTPSEEAGDCEALCTGLSQLLASQGVVFRYNTPVERLAITPGGLVQAYAHDSPLDADAIVLANGTGAQSLAKDAGINLHIYPLRGYSLTYSVDNNSGAPQASVSDIRNKVVYARIGDKLRVAGMIDIGINDPQAIEQRTQTLKSQVKDFFPALKALEPPVAWSGQRPARPDSKPLIGATAMHNLFINAGHGALGFTLAFGSARLLAESVDGDSSPNLHLAARFSL
ncbi:D-amino acid dehydrogenase [Paenalcaligenes niemegkensis]|uniref:D-amino acid dehydrogenase n=1 Tax=Paenalcaligenes niemegkensis TaxID=2895469 RepID=UPI001EE95E6D|nr:D-amino acid dehydrogenase [Paenalcaligenes niemegkensis]MCQ9618209.1 D-amino acid dehydrogenase [Paenalcaligenes niemegkensis]